MSTVRAFRLMKKTLGLFLPAAALIVPIAVVNAQQSSPAALVGNVERGKILFTTYKCYACHGTSGQEGSPRLAPMSRNQADFIAFVRKPTAAGMPPYSDVTEQALADVYAYIRSIPAASPPLESIPLLNDILRQIRE